jgi:alkane 1-monooxygenase
LNETIAGWDIVLASLSTGVQAGTSAIVVAHELIHRKNKIKKSLGLFLLFSAGNVYFYTAHLKIHHKWVGTEKDPSSAKMNENLYAFFIRSVIGQLMDSYQLEQKQDKTVNAILLQITLQIVWLIVLFSILGIGGVLAWLIHSLTAAFLLEYVNYIEHYGLNRKNNERCTEMHSWDSDKLVSRFVLVDLSRHADHHYYASKPYHTLNAYSQGNKLPAGYAGLFFIAAIPPLWYKVIHPRISKV